MELGRTIFAFAITMVLSISSLTMMINDTQDQGGTTKITTKSSITTTNYRDHHHDDREKLASFSLPPPSKRVSRFLATRNPRAADQCRRDNAVCTAGGKNATCCNNKCVDLSYDDDNCGTCKNKCFYTETCCRGECVYLAYDKRHCGECNFKCDDGEYCVYGMCNYA